MPKQSSLLFAVLKSICLFAALPIYVTPSALGAQNHRDPVHPTTACTTQKNVNESINISSSQILCGNWAADNFAAGEKLINITASHLTLECAKNFTFEANESLGTVANPTVAIYLEGVENVTIKNCQAHGFRYGVFALNSKNIKIINNDFSKNYHDPAAGWVQDKFQGGGIRFERIEKGQISKNILAENWNGIELRHSNAIIVANNLADNCSNTGITLVNSHYNTIKKNDFSWAVRGPAKPTYKNMGDLEKFLAQDALKALKFKASWYVVDTKDSAGIILDYGSSHNKVIDNDFSFGGDGIFVRSVIGACAENNYFSGNDTTYSPHNAIESWCDGNTFENNDASYSHYGVWLGGSDNTVVKGNKINHNIVDGISIQIAEGRHNTIVGNEITHNGRVGVLLTGREYQAWHELSRIGSKLANSSDILVLDNSFAKNGVYDAFVTSTRSAYFINNTTDQKKLNIMIGHEAENIFVSDESFRFDEAPEATPQDKSNADIAALNQDHIADAQLKTSRTSITVGESTYIKVNVSNGDEIKKIEWVIQENKDYFGQVSMPKAIYHDDSLEKTSLNIKFLKSGIYDINVFVLTNSGAKTFSREIFVKAERALRVNDMIGSCPLFDFKCSVKIEKDTKRSALPGYMVSTNTAYAMRAIFYVEPAQILEKNVLEFFVRAHNVNGKWQSTQPPLVLHFDNGQKIIVTPSYNWLPVVQESPKHVKVDLNNSAIWSLSAELPTSDLIAIEFPLDTFGWEPYSVVLGGFSVSGD